MCNYKELLKAIDAYIRKADEDLAYALGAEGYAKPKKTLKYAEDIEDGVAEALLDETEYIIAEAEKSVDLEAFAEDVWPRVKLNDAAKAKLTTVFTESFSEFMPEFVGYYLKQTDKDLKLLQVSKKTTAWVKSWSKELGEIMQLNSHTEIENILERGLQNGSSIADFTRAILDSGIRDEYYKARRVAITEVLTAHRAAQQEAFMQSPVVSEKMWRHTGEYRNEPRQNHVDMDGQRVPVGEPFELIGADGGTYNPMYPGDPILPAEERINCHCIDQPVVSEEILGLPLEERQRLQQEAIDKMDDEWEKELDVQNKAQAGIEKSWYVQEITSKVTGAAMEVFKQLGIKCFTPAKKSDIIKEGWITTEDGNHVYIDADGNAKGGSEGYAVYQGESLDSGGSSGGGSNTATRGHREEECLHGEDAVNAIMEDTGLSEEEAEKIAIAIDDFTCSGYIEIRAAQEAGKTSGTDAEHGKLLEKYIEKAPKWDGGEIYRLVELEEDDLYELLDAYEEEEPIHQYGTSSWTSSKKSIRKFVYSSEINGIYDDLDEKPIHVVFHARGTKQGTSVRHLSGIPDENEVIISKNARWKVTDAPYQMEERLFGETATIIYVECEEV